MLRRDNRAGAAGEVELAALGSGLEPERLERPWELSLDVLLPRAAEQVAAPLDPEVVELALAHPASHERRGENLGEPSEAPIGRRPPWRERVPGSRAAAGSVLALDRDNARRAKGLEVGARRARVHVGGLGELGQRGGAALGEAARDAEADGVGDCVEVGHLSQQCITKEPIAW